MKKINRIIDILKGIDRIYKPTGLDTHIELCSGSWQVNNEKKTMEIRCDNHTKYSNSFNERTVHFNIDDFSISLYMKHSNDDLLCKEYCNMYFILQDYENGFLGNNLTEWKCLRCNDILFSFSKDGFKYKCLRCGWINELSVSYREEPIVILKGVETSQICYPEVSEKDIECLPSGVKKALSLYFQENLLSTANYQNIYHNIYKKNIKNLEKKIEIYQSRLKIVKFFQSFNFMKK